MIPMRSRNKIVTFVKALMPCLTFLFLSINYFPSKQTGVRRNLAGLYCCTGNLHFNDNAGHKLTDNVLDLHRCKPAVSFRNTVRPLASSAHFTQIANLVGTSILGRDQCLDAHSRLPLKPTEGRMKAYSRFAVPEWSYDAIEVRDRLRDAQMKVFTSCGMDLPSFKHINVTVDTNAYDQITYRPPSMSVNIIRRAVDRVLLNAQEILDMCKGLDLHCRIIEVDDLFLQPEAKDLCFVLKKFAHAVNIGMQGAQNIYAHYASSRMILVKSVTPVTAWNYSNPINTLRFGNDLASDEVQRDKNLISKDPRLFDWFHLEFGAHFGNYLDAVHGEIDTNSLEIMKRTSHKVQCKSNPSYCANYNADIPQIKVKLEALIDKGHLLTIQKQNWWIQMCETRKICLHGSRLKGNATLNGANELE